MFIYLNGEYVEGDKAVISPYDHGYLYGLGIFETFRIYDGHPFLLDDHLERLHEGLQQLNIDVTISKEKVTEIINTLLYKNDLKDAYIRLNVSAGIGEIGLQTMPYCEPNVICFIKPLPPKLERVYKQAMILKIPRNTPEGNIRLKSHHYLNNVLAKREIDNNGNVEGIFLTADGFVAEGIVSNVFFVKESIVYTPCLETGILNGITRKYVLDLCKENDIQIKEGYYTKEMLLDSDEVFVTNSIQEIVSIDEIDGRKKQDFSMATFLMSHYEKERMSREKIKE
ncbi:MAG: aminodeoxychorismate lyase [Bacillaceae bacterium]